MADAVFKPGIAEQLAAVWDTGPAVLRGALTAPLFSSREYLTGILGTARDFAADPKNRFGRVFVRGEVVTPEQLPAFLPSGPSEDIEEYVGRVARAHDDFAVILNACERYIPAIRATFVPLLHGLFSRVGYPVQSSLACIYSGTYQTSPFGIHTDPCHVLMSCGLGSKTMAFWPRSHFDSMKSSFYDNKVPARVADHLAAATVMQISPGDLLYWPANTWHVGISETLDFHASVSLGLYHRASRNGLFLSQDFMPTRPFALPQVEQYDSLDLTGLGPSLLSRGSLSIDDVRAAPLGGFLEIWHRVAAELNKAEEAEYRALKTVLMSLSSAGFGPPRASVDARLPVDTVLEDAVLQCEIPESLIAARVRGGLLVGANGHLFFHPAHVTELEQVLAALRAGEAQSHDAMVASARSAGRAVADLLSDLVSAGAVSCAHVARPHGQMVVS